MTALQGQHFFISGRVQGVFYRRFACKEAQVLQLTGWARNLDDGRVEIKAFGPPQALAIYHKKLQQGPIAAQVKAVEAEDIEIEIFSGFEVI